MANAPFPSHRLAFVFASLLPLSMAVGVPRSAIAAGSPLGAPPAKKAAASATPPTSGDSATDNQIMSSLLGADGSTGGTSAGQAAPPAWYGQFQAAVQAAQSGKRAQAKALFQRLLRTQPHLAAAWANLAILDAQGGQNAAAAQDLQHAIAESKDVHELIGYWAQMTLIRARLSQWAECAAAARKTIDLSPANAPSATFGSAYLGIALLHQAKYAEALPILGKRPRLNNEPPQAADLRLIFALEKAGLIGDALKAAKDVAKQYASNPAAVAAVRSVGDFAVQNNRYDIAVDAYQTAFAAHPDDTRVGFNVVAAAIRNGQSDLAMRTLRTMLARAPKDPKVNFETGLLLSSGTTEVARLKEAETHLKIAATQDPTNALYITQWGLVVVLQGPTRLEEGINLLRGALQLDPRMATAHLYLGYAYEQKAETDKPNRLSHFSDAVGQYEAVIALGKTDDSDARARNRRAGILYTLNDKDDAYKGWQALTDRYSNEYGVEALAETASRLLSDGRLPEAKRDYARLTVLRPKDPSNFVGLGQTEERMKDLVGAQQQYESALQIEPGDATAALALGNVLKSQNKPQDAIAVYEKTIAAATPAPGTGRASADREDQANLVRLQLGSDYAQIGQKEKALEIYRKLTLRKDDPNQSVYLLTAPRFLIGEKRYAEAEQDLTKLVLEHPSDDEAAYELARAQSLNGHGAAAIETLNKLATRYLTNPPRRIRALMQIADVEVGMGQLDAGATQYEDVLRLDPTQPNALSGLSGARGKQGHPEATGTFLENLALGGDKSPNPSVVRDLQALYLTMDRTPDRFDAFLSRLAEKYSTDRSTQLFVVSNLLSPTEATKIANRTSAQTIVDRLLKADTKDAQALYWRGFLHEQAGRKPDAIADYTASVESDFSNAPAIDALKRLGAPVPAAPAKTTATPPPPAAPTAAPLPTVGAAPTGQIPTVAPVSTGPTSSPAPKAP